MIIDEMVQSDHDEFCPDRSTYSLWSHEGTVVKESKSMAIPALRGISPSILPSSKLT